MDSENNGKNGRDDSGRFAAGNPGKPKGAMTNASAKVKQAIYNFLEDNIDSIQESFDSLKAKEKLQFISELIPYAMPRLQSIQSENETNITGGITIKWEEPNIQAGQDKGSTSDVQSV